MVRDGSKLLRVMGAVVALVGCSGARDVEVSGSVTAPKALAVEGALVIDFVDVVGSGKAAERRVAGRAELTGLGEFAAKVTLEGEQVQVRVIEDRDGDGACSSGEAWGEVYAPVEADRATDVSLMLWVRACPSS